MSTKSLAKTLQLHTEPINWEKQVGLCAYYHGPNDLCGISIWRGLPTLVTEMICKCNKNYFTRTSSLSAKGGSLGTFCLDCGMPNICSISRNYYTCESCSRFFTYDWRTITKVPQQLLCKECDVPVTSLVRNRTSGISFS